jgi:hypothetical protein
MGAYADRHHQSLHDRDAFWRERAALIDWETPYSQLLDYSRPPFARWFVGGRTNLCHNAIDRHLDTRGDQPALIFISTETGQRRTCTFRELFDEVNRFAASLRAQGVGKGDRVLIYMPMIPEAVFAMLATVRLGAVHSVVFGGFAAASLATRVDDAKPRVMVTADAGMRGGKPVPYKHLVDEALRLAKHPPAKVIIVDRGLDAAMSRTPGRDLDYATLARQHAGEGVPCAWLESSEPSYILYTSGTTGKPKGVQRDTGGYAVALIASMRDIFCVAPGGDDVHHQRHRLGGRAFVHRLCAAPERLTTIMYEGLPISPDPAIWWQIAAEHKVGTMFSRPPRSACSRNGTRLHEEARPLLPALPVPRRRAAGRAHRALGIGFARRGDHRSLLANGERLADPVGFSRDRGHAAQVRKPVLPGVRLRRAAARRGDRKRDRYRSEGRAHHHAAVASGLHDHRLGRRRALRQYLLLHGAGADGGLLDVSIGATRDADGYYSCSAAPTT